MTRNSRVEYVTTAIVYPNSRIHVGFAWEVLGADWLARSLKSQGKEVFFATGMDEHSLNVQRAAEGQGLTPQAYCDQMSVDIQKVLRQMGAGYDRFIRTSDPDHERVVQALVKRAFDKGDIYKAKYEGLYCEGCEAFYTEKDLTNGKCPSHGTAPKQISEENYFFKLSKYEKPLLELFEKQPDFLVPEYRKNEVVNFVKQGLKDFSVSRSTFTWGVPLPWDPKHVVYVWFDALINYLTAAGYEFKLKDPASPEAIEFDRRWPAKLHIVGKDITRFHCVYWPAMLMSLEIPLPRQVFAHGYITIGGERMSKSSGNVVQPDSVMEITGPDPFRYYMLAENQFAQDGNYDFEALIRKANADLSNDWGNLVNRTLNMTRKYFSEQALAAPAKITHSAEVRASFEKLPAELAHTVANVDTAAYCAAATARSRVLNLYIDRTKPWALAKTATPESMSELHEVLYTLMEGIRWVATALLPVLPFKMPEVFDQLAIPRPELPGVVAALKWGVDAQGAAIAYQPGVPSPIYPRIELPKVEGAAEAPAPAKGDAKKK